MNQNVSGNRIIDDLLYDLILTKDFKNDKLCLIIVELLKNSKTIKNYNNEWYIFESPIWKQKSYPLELQNCFKMINDYLRIIRRSESRENKDIINLRMKDLFRNGKHKILDNLLLKKYIKSIDGFKFDENMQFQKIF